MTQHCNYIYNEIPNNQHELRTFHSFRRTYQAEWCLDIIQYLRKLYGYGIRGHLGCLSTKITQTKVH